MLLKRCNFLPEKNELKNGERTKKKMCYSQKCVIRTEQQRTHNSKKKYIVTQLYIILIILYSIH